MEKWFTKKTKRWSIKYKRSIDCNHPRGFSQRQHCKYGRRKTKKNRYLKFTRM